MASVVRNLVTSGASVSYIPPTPIEIVYHHRK